MLMLSAIACPYLVYELLQIVESLHREREVTQLRGVLEALEIVGGVLARLSHPDILALVLYGEADVPRENAELLFCGSPTTSLEKLFLDIIQESEARPGKRVRGGGNA